MVFGIIYLAWFGFILDKYYVVSLAKPLFNFILEKRCVDRNAPDGIQNCSSDTFYIPYSSANNWSSTQLKTIIQALPQSEKLREI